MPQEPWHPGKSAKECIIQLNRREVCTCASYKKTRPSQKDHSRWSVEEFIKIIRDIKTNKALAYEIPAKILKESKFIFDVLSKCINKSIETWYFPHSLRLANVAPVFWKGDLLDKSNYRSVHILPLLSKVYKKIIYNQLSDCSDSFMNNMPCGFQKAHSTQHALFKLLQSRQQVLDNRDFIGTILTDQNRFII